MPSRTLASPTDDPVASLLSRAPTTPDAHALARGVGETLLALELDPVIVQAGTAAPLVAAGLLSQETLAAEIGAEAAALTREVLALPALEAIGGLVEQPTPVQAENLRKLLLAVIRDGRVIVIRLAERLHELRSAKRLAVDEQRRLALTTREIYAPLANRLGIWQLKWELEDLAFRYLEPENYKQVAAWLKERRSDRETYLQQASAQLQQGLKLAGLEAAVLGRPKHIYSIWRKMQRKGLDFDHLYDLYALRLLVHSVADCYAALGVVHGLWHHIQKEFDDYIALPKDNQYRSLHTAVIGPEGRPLEIQIRSHDMHRHAELGVASHWRYKEGGHYDPALETRIGWMRQLLSPGGSDEDFIERFRTELVEERVYVLTPRGDVFDLPRGATALDFAYHVHTDVGHRCRGARVNGRLMPIGQVLASGDQVEILTGRPAEPSRDWLNPQSGYLFTGRARDKVRAYFRQQDRSLNASYGRDALERELDRLALRDFRQDRLLKHFQFEALDDLFAALGAGDLTSAQLAGALQRELAQSKAPPAPKTRRTPRRGNQSPPVTLPGIAGEVLVSLARCCRPVPGEVIRGYVTQGHGISVHRLSCASLARLAARAPQRLCDVTWNADDNHSLPVDISVDADDRRGLLNDIMAVLADMQLRLVALDTRSDSDMGMLQVKLTVNVPGLPQLSGLLSRLLQVPGVQHAVRKA
jgi:GTP pyrophosphokinase